jgi:hypothetical protein
VFGNKGYRWKLGAGLALIAVLGISAGLRGHSINPPVWHCLGDPTGTDGARIWVPAAWITTVHDHEYEIQADIAQIRVSGPAPAPAGSRISMIAIFHGAGPMLEPLRTRVLPDSGLYRLLMEIASVIVALAVFANFARHFLFRPRVLQVGREGT